MLSGLWPLLLGLQVACSLGPWPLLLGLRLASGSMYSLGLRPS